MVVEMRVIEADASEDENGAQAEAYLPPSRFQTGVIELEHDFKKKKLRRFGAGAERGWPQRIQRPFRVLGRRRVSARLVRSCLRQGEVKKRNSKRPESLFGKWKTGGIERSRYRGGSGEVA